MRIRRVVVYVFALTAAGFVGLSTFVIANEIRAPGLSVLVGGPAKGIAQGNIALQSTLGRKVQDPRAQVTPADFAIALESYRAEPLMVTALGLIGSAPQKVSARAQGDAILTLAGGLSRRDPLLTSLLIEQAAKKSDGKRFFAWLSRAALTSSALRTSYVEAMAESTSRPDAIAALVPVLGANPSWSEYYWRSVLGKQASLINAAKLRLIVARPPWNLSKVTDEDKGLALQLAAVGQFAAAQNLVSTLVGDRPDGSVAGNLLVNGDFYAEPRFAPFDWDLTSSGELGGAIVSKERSLMISAVAGATGVVAKQLVRLPDRSYSLGWALDAGTGARNGEPTLIARLRCADPSQKAVPVDVISMQNGRHRQAVNVPKDGCEWYWFSIEANLTNNAAGLDAVLRSLTLTAASGIAPKVSEQKS